MKFIFTLLLVIYPSLVFAGYFASVDEYVSHITGGIPVLSGSVQVFADKNVFGAAHWGQRDGAESTQAASVFVLEKLKNGTFKEIVRSKPSGGFWTQAIDGIDSPANDRFSVNLHSFSPLGGTTYRFALIGKSWYFSGQDEAFLYYHPEKGDEAMGDTRVERSANFWTGIAIERQFEKNKLTSTKRTKKKVSKRPLSEFKFFD